VVVSGCVQSQYAESAAAPPSRPPEAPGRKPRDDSLTPSSRVLERPPDFSAAFLLMVFLFPSLARVKCLRTMSSIRAGSSAVSSSEFALHAAFRFLRENAVPVMLFSVLLLIPCFWHTHIQAGDLGSHVYNAWLAQLAERHEISGVIVVRQWSN